MAMERLNKWIPKHEKGLVRFFVILMIVWYVGGMILVDIMNPWLFLGLWVPVGALTAWFSFKW